MNIKVNLTRPNQFAVKLKTVNGGGAEDLNAVLTEQETLIDELKEVLKGKASGGGSEMTGTGADIYVIYGGQLWDFFDFAAYAFPEYDITREFSRIAVIDNPPQYKKYPYLFPIIVSPIDGKIQILLDENVLGYITYIGLQDFTSIHDHGWIDKETLESLDATDDANIGFYSVKAVSYPLLDGTLTELKSTTTELRMSFSGFIFLTSVDLPNAKTLYYYTFDNCEALSSVSIPSVEFIKACVFRQCISLEKIHFGSQIKTLGHIAFEDCSSLKTLIIHNTTEVCELVDSSLRNTPIENGEGYIYVPKELVDEYKSATNWSEFADQIRAIEDYPEICGGEG